MLKSTQEQNIKGSHRVTVNFTDRQAHTSTEHATSIYQRRKTARRASYCVYSSSSSPRLRNTALQQQGSRTRSVKTSNSSQNRTVLLHSRLGEKWQLIFHFFSPFADLQLRTLRTRNNIFLLAAASVS